SGVGPVPPGRVGPVGPVPVGPVGPVGPVPPVPPDGPVGPVPVGPVGPVGPVRSGVGVRLGGGEYTGCSGPTVCPSNEGVVNDSTGFPCIATVMKSCQIAAGIVPP